MSSIHPQYLTFGKLLNTRLFRIPDYQRAYSWAKKQRSDLFEDIDKAYKKKSDHFMAAMVALRRDKILIGTDEYQITEVVDGQQRITTLILLLKAIELNLNRMERSQDRMASELAELLVKPENDALLLLQTNHDTSHFFANYLRQGTHPDPIDAKTIADQNLLTAMVECEAFVEKWKASSASLVELLALIKNGLAFILHEIEDESAVYNVFEVLNSRGLEVSWLDRLKSILMGAAFELKAGNKAEVIKELHRLWRDIYACVGLRQGMSTESLRFAATLRADHCPNKPLGEEDSVETLQTAARTAKEILKTAQWLLAVTKACDGIMGNKRLNAVTRIAQARLLATAVNLRPDLRHEEKSELLRLWENITFRIYAMHRNDARTRVGDYVRLAWRVVNEEIQFQDIVKSLKELGAAFPVKESVENLRDTDCYSVWGDELRYFFFRYEEHLANKQGLNFSNEQWERIWMASAADSIEHIWPQSKAPESQVHRLGNLVLLPPKLNSKLQNLKPIKKADAYTKTGLLIAQEVAEKLSTPWKKPAIDKREDILLKWAMTEWKD